MMELNDVLQQDYQVTLNTGKEGKVYNLSDLNLNAQALIQERLGVKVVSDETYGEPDAEGNKPTGIQYLMQEIIKSPQILRFLTWILLLRDNRTMTEDQVGYMINVKNRLDVTEGVIHQLVKSVPHMEDEEKKAYLDGLRVKEEVKIGA